MFYLGVIFEACKKNAVFREGFMSFVTGEPQVEDGHRPTRQFQYLYSPALMGFAIWVSHKFRKLTITAKTDMKFDGNFCFAKIGQGRDGKTEFNNLGIKQIEIAVEL